MAPSCRFIWSPLVILASCHRPSHSFPSVISFEPEATRRKDDDEEMNGEGTRWAEGHGSSLSVSFLVLPVSLRSPCRLEVRSFILHLLTSHRLRLTERNEKR